MAVMGDKARLLETDRFVQAPDDGRDSERAMDAMEADGTAEASDAVTESGYRRAAEAGDTAAQFYLGGMYSEGRGVPHVYVEAARFYRMAAERGDGQAQYNLGLAYARGEGVEQDLVTAHLYFNLAAARLNDPRGRAAATKNRDHLAAEISSEQLEQAQKLAREWRPKIAAAS